jgi:hypothetical protein
MGKRMCLEFYFFGKSAAMGGRQLVRMIRRLLHHVKKSGNSNSVHSL